MKHREVANLVKNWSAFPVSCYFCDSFAANTIDLTNDKTILVCDECLIEVVMILGQNNLKDLDSKSMEVVREA